MASIQLPHISIIIVNYDGRRFLDACLTAVREAEYPQSQVETILVDNGSSDGSAEYVAERFPWVTVIRSERNLGFAGGNNLAIRCARGEFVALLNNDTVVDPGWLRELVNAAQSDHRIGICTSKLVFLHDRLPVTIESSPLSSSDTASDRVGYETVSLSSVDVEGLPLGQGVHFGLGFAGWRNCEAGAFTPVGRAAHLDVEVPDKRKDLSLRFWLGRGMSPGSGARATIKVNGYSLGAFNVSSDTAENPVTVVVPSERLEFARPFIQNAGSRILPDGSGKDRGDQSTAGVIRHEEDSGQYDVVQEVFSFCGASALLRRRMLDEIGLLDDWFFMYYEDTDLSWRARLRGWKVAYVPTSRVRHVHCGSSGEWSPFFAFHVERNRLALLIKNAPAPMVVREAWKYTHRLLAACRGTVEGVFHRDLAAVRVAGGQARWRGRVLISLLLRLPVLLGQRFRARARGRLSDEELVNWMTAE